MLGFFKEPLNLKNTQQLFSLLVFSFIFAAIPLTVTLVLNARSLSTPAATTTTNQLAPGEQYLSPLIPASNNQDSARIYGDKVVFYNYNLGNCCDSNLTLYDLKTKTSRIISTTKRGYNDAPLPSISDNYVVWDDAGVGGNANMDIWLYDLSTNSKRALFNQAYHESRPSVSGSKVAWLDKRSGNLEVYVYDLSTGVEKRITNSPSDKISPQISGDRIVWQDFADQTVHLYDLATNTDRILAKATNPSISGNKVAWIDSLWDGTRWLAEVYLYDLSTNIQRRLTYTNLTATKSYLDMSGNILVWIDYRNEPGGGGLYVNGDIYSYDLTTNRENRITYDTNHQIKPSVSGSRIVWTDNRSGYKNIYIYDPPPPINLTFNPIEDATISKTQPTTNFGSANYLVSDASPKKTFLIKFNISGLNGKIAKSVKLRFYCTEPSGFGGNVYLTSGRADWQEEAVTWNTAPATPTLLGAFGKVLAGNYYEVELYPRIKGEGVLSLAVSTPFSDGVVYSSKEAVNASQRPQLIYTVQ